MPFHSYEKVVTIIICTDRHIVVPSSLAEKSGLQPSQVQISEKYGGGYPANVEGLHHLHCLVSSLIKFYTSLLT